jgi:hypothetical protein
MTAPAVISDARRETIESWVAMVGRASSLRVEPILSRMRTESDLVDALDAVLQTHHSAFDSFVALRDYLVGELLVESSVVSVPVVDRYPSPWDVPVDLLRGFFRMPLEKGPALKIRQYYDSAMLDAGRPIKMFDNANVGDRVRTNLNVRGQLSYNAPVLLTSWWILVPEIPGIESVLNKCCIDLRVHHRSESCLNALALRRPRPLLVFLPVGTMIHADISCGSRLPLPPLFLYLEGWEGSE